MVASVGKILCESGNAQFFGIDDHMADTLCTTERRRLVQLAFGKGMRAYRGGNYALPQLLMRHAQKEGRIHTRRERHDRTPDAAQALAELFKLRERLCVFLLA